MKLKRFIKQFDGSSFPTLIETEDSREYIIKMRGSGNGPKSLISEFIANKIAFKLGWQVPDVDWVYIDENFPWVFGTDEFDDILVKSSGWNLAIQYLPAAVTMGLSSDDLKNEELINQIYTFDRFFINIDRTSKSNNFLKDKDQKIWFIDHGSLALFNSGLKTNTLFLNHIFLVMGMNQNPKYQIEIHNKRLFSETIKEIPKEILNESEFTRETLMRIIDERINLLSE